MFELALKWEVRDWCRSLQRCEGMEELTWEGKLQVHGGRAVPAFNRWIELRTDSFTPPCNKDIYVLRSIEAYSSKQRQGASLVAQWLRVCLLMQGTRVRALVWEDPTCRGAAGPVSHNC